MDKRENRKRRKKGSSIGSTIVLIIALGVFCYSGLQLFHIFASYKKGDDEYKEIRNLVIKVEKQESKKGKEKKKPDKYIIDFEKLREINPDVVAWIRFEEPSVINYPVVHSHDNKEYLTRLFGEGKNTYGTLFVDKNNDGGFGDKNTFIYGHRMKSGSMFGKLEKYMDESFYKKHPYFYIYTPDGKESKYQIFSAGVVTDTSESYNKVYESDEEYLKYIEHIKSMSYYETGVEVTADSKIVSLSTCTVESNENRFLVHAVKVDER